MSGSAVQLPEHVADSQEWQQWPKRVDAHLVYGVRERQVAGLVRTGKLKVYTCPDGSSRMDPDVLRQHFGAPGVVQGRDRDLSLEERRRRQADAALDSVDDVLALCFRESVVMMRDLHRELIAVLRVVGEPMGRLIAGYERANELQAKRIEVLEAHVDDALALRSELADAKQERDLSFKRHEASERRRDETLTLLKDQVPQLARMYLEGESLSGWARRVPRDVLNSILESDALSESDAEHLRRAAGLPPKQPPNQANGVSHGHT